MLLTRNSRKRGFTLVELMVAAALAITIMWILSESFKMGIDFARSARSTGDMMTQLNNVGQIMTRDLTGGTHFYNPGAMRNINTVTMPDNLTTTAPNLPYAAGGYTTPNGYFRLFSPPPQAPYPLPSAASFPDNTEGYSINTINPATTGTPSGTYLAFTAFLSQGLPQNQFVATAPPGSGNIYYSRAAEIGYFLGSPQGIGQSIGQTAPVVVTPDMTTPGTPAYQQYLNGGQPLPLYNLYRRQRLVAVNSDYAQLVPSPQPGQTPYSPPNLNAPVMPPTMTVPNPYYDPNAADVISFTPLPPGQSQPVQVNTLTGPNSFGQAYTFTTPPKNPPPPLPAYSFRYPLNGNGTPSLLAPLTTAGRVGDDILLSNVLSFEVLATWDPDPNINQPPIHRNQPPQPIPWPRPFSSNTGIVNSNYPFDYLPALHFNPAIPAHTFDTWYVITNNTRPNPMRDPNWNNFALAPRNPNLIPMPIRINAIQVTIRIYDPKTNQARQNTWRFAL